MRVSEIVLLKRKYLLSILKDRRFEMVVLGINNVFFAFMAWLAYPQTFYILLGCMLGFTWMLLVVIFFYQHRKQARQKQLFYDWMQEPSLEQEDKWIGMVGLSYQPELKYLCTQWREQAQELAQEKEKRKDYEEFIESWVHEIKRPISLAWLVLENRREEMSELVCQRWEHSTRQIQDSVEKILYYARLQAAHIDYYWESLSLAFCCKEVVASLESLWMEKKIKIIYLLQEIQVVSDYKTLCFILTQILVNAVNYGIPFDEEETNPVHPFIQLESGWDREGKGWFLSIADNGKGVKESDLPFIFDKGFTGNKTTHSTGMGLYLVKKLCDTLKVTLRVETKEKKGFCIKLLFPQIDKKF